MIFTKATSTVNTQALTLIFTILLSDISRPIAEARQINVVIPLTVKDIQLRESTSFAISKHNKPNNADTNSASTHLIQLIFIFLIFCAKAITFLSPESGMQLPN